MPDIHDYKYRFHYAVEYCEIMCKDKEKYENITTRSIRDERICPILTLDMVSPVEKKVRQPMVKSLRSMGLWTSVLSDWPYPGLG